MRNTDAGKPLYSPRIHVITWFWHSLEVFVIRFLFFRILRGNILWTQWTRIIRTVHEPRAYQQCHIYVYINKYLSSKVNYANDMKLPSPPAPLPTYLDDRELRLLLCVCVIREISLNKKLCCIYSHFN